MKALNIMAIIGAALLAAVLMPEVSANPYDGYNTIGDYRQWHVAYQGNVNSAYQYSTGPLSGGTITYPNAYYNYGTTPQLGGNFGSWYTAGLRTPVNYCVTPTHYATGWRQGCGYSSGRCQGGHCGGGQAFGPNTAPIRTRYGGGFI